jgi:SCO1/SenC
MSPVDEKAAKLVPTERLRAGGHGAVDACLFVVIRQAHSRLYGHAAEIAQIAKEYRVYYKKVPTEDGGYTMDHSAVIYLMGPDGKLVTVIPYQENDTSASLS